MLLSLSLIFLMGLLFSFLCEKIRIPRIIGMLFTGIILGPCALNMLSPSIILVSPDLRKLALVIILLKAGLSLNFKDLKKVGRPSLLLSFLPASFEIIAFTVLSPLFFPDFSFIDGAVMGSVLSAVSPAVVVPRMVNLIENNYGTKKGIPQMILAGASLDDVFVIVIFSALTKIASGGNVSSASFLSVPVSILSGALLGAAAGFVLSHCFEIFYRKKRHIRNSTKIIIILGSALLLISLEDILKSVFPLSGLLSVMCMSMAIKAKSPLYVAERLSQKLGKLWLCAELVLFVLVGAAVDITYLLSSGITMVILIMSALLIRTIGTEASLFKSSLNKKEKLFTAVSYMPKATVQAAIGSVPLAMGLSCGKAVLTASVTAIIITAPLGAVLMDSLYKKLLTKDTE